MRVLSLFDGISCGQVALERAGIPVEVYYASEIDSDAIQVTQKNFPNTIQLGDVIKIDFTQFIDKVDLLIGGSPCTHWSIARGVNRETTSSGLGWDLFSKYLEAKEIIKPKYFLYENNESMSDEIKAEITKKLKVEPIMINSSDFSAQIRKRLYWTNIDFESSYLIKNLLIKDIIFDDSYKVKNFDKYATTTIVSTDGLSVKWDSSGKGYYSQQNRAKSKNTKMNTVTARGIDKCNIWLGNTTYRHLHPVEAERLQTLPDNYTDCLSDAKRIKAIGNGWTVDVIAYIFQSLKQEYLLQEAA